MASFSRREEFLQASRITGPTHNFLALNVTESELLGPPIFEQLTGGSCHHGPISPALITQYILEGLELAHQKLGRRYGVSHIQILHDDFPPEVTYGALTFYLIQHLANGGDFPETDYPITKAPGPLPTSKSPQNALSKSPRRETQDRR